MAQLTKHEHWQIEESDADDLAKKTRKWLDTLDKAKIRKLEQKYGKYIPGAQLVIALSVLTIPRIVQTIDKGKKAHAPVREVEEPAPSHASNNGRAAPAPAARASRADDAVSPSARASAGRWNPVEVEPEPDPGASPVIRPFRGTDGAAFDFGADA